MEAVDRTADRLRRLQDAFAKEADARITAARYTEQDDYPSAPGAAPGPDT
ncbi:hypothetical protein [Streptomyces sp. NPDC001568]